MINGILYGFESNCMRREEQTMRRRVELALLAAVFALLLTGCLFRTTDDLYALPQRFPGYENLTNKRSEIQKNLELEYGTTVETAVVYSGDNTSVIQFQDMDGDGERETAVISFRIPGAERSLRVYFLTTQEDGETYEVSAVVEGDGSGINAIDYVELSGGGKKEVVVSWRTVEGVGQLGAYSLDELERNETVPVALELLMTGYSGYSLLDIDRDTRIELAVVKLDPAGTDSTVEVYGWRGGRLDRMGSAGLSAGITSLTSNGVRINYLTDTIPALYITSTLSDGGRATDIIALQGSELVNLAMNPETGVSRETVRGYGDVDPTDVNSDAILEIPHPHPLPTYGDSLSADFWLIDWTQYNISGDSTPVFTTYHNMFDEWYLIVPGSWVDQITISRNDRTSGSRAVIFSRWNGAEREPTPFLVIYKLTGINSSSRANREGRFILAEDSDAIYAAEFYADSWDCGLDETGVRDSFRLMLSSWASD